MPGNGIRFGVGVTGAKGAASELDKLRDKFTNLQKQGAKGIGVGVGAAVTTKALGLVGSAVGSVTGFLDDSVRAYREQEVATGRLNASLKANVSGWTDSGGAIEAQNKKLMALGFTDTEAVNSLALLVAATHNVEEAFRVQAVAADLARFKGISLSEASEALTKVEGGSFRILKSLGIQLKDNATSTEALAAVEKVAGGQAREFAESDLGKLDAASAKTEAAQEKLGATMSKVGATVLPVVADGFSQLVDNIEQSGVAFGNNLATVYLWATGQDKAQAATAALEARITNTSAVVGKLADDLAAGAPLIAKGVDTGIRRPFEDGLEELVARTKTVPLEIGLGLREGQSAVDGAMQTLKDAMLHPISGAKRIAHLEGLLNGKELAKGLKSADPLVRQAAQEEKQAILDEMDKLRRAAPDYGARTAKAYADGLRSQYGYVQGAAKVVVGGAVGAFKASSPPGPESPLHLIDKWGEKTGQAWADGLARGADRDFGGMLRGTVPAFSAAPGDAPSPGNSAFGRSGGAGLHGQATRANAAHGGDTYHFHFPNAVAMTPGSAEAFARTVTPAIATEMRKRRLI